MCVFKCLLEGEKVKVLFIDDHPLINRGLASYLEETGRFSVCGQVNSLTEAKQFIQDAVSDFPSLIILDILLGEENGLDFLPFLENFCRAKNIPKPPVLICSVLEDPFRIQTALKMGASGYVSKTGNISDLLNAIDTILRGKRFVTDEYSIKLDESLGSYTQFTKREFEILHQVKQSKTNQQIAKTLSISLRTVENHISNIYFKTGKNNRLELMQL